MLDDSSFEVLFSADEIRSRIGILGEQITKDYDSVGEDTVMIAVLKGSILFYADLVRQVQLPITMDFIGISSYGDKQESSGVVRLTQDLSTPIKDKHVIVVEDIIDTGLTAHYLLENLQTRSPASLKLCSLLHKPDGSKKAVDIDYLGFTIPDKFVVGYGLDISQRYRNLDYIGWKK